MKKSYLPQADGLFSTWLNTFASKIGTYATKYSINAAEVTAIQAAALFYAYWYGQAFNFDQLKQNLISYKNEIRYGIKAGGTAAMPPANITFMPPPAVDPGLEAGIRSIVGRIKKNQAYSVTDGRALGIEGDEHVIDVPNMKPVFKIVLLADHPNLEWIKGAATAVKIMVDRGATGGGTTGGTPGGFIFLATDTVPDYLDTHALPAAGVSAVWKYKMRYLINDEEVGLWSDDQSITVVGV